jgi:2-desacetyl-2-hydroxyethyl bacteriochlorophyllide A dehydrogenase
MSWPTGEMATIVMAGAEDIQLEERPIPAEEPGSVLARVEYVGLCGTDAELLRGSSPFLATGVTRYPFVPGHEWAGTIAAAGPGVSGVGVGDRVVGNPFITCGACRFCLAGRRNLCLNRFEMGVRGNYQGAAAGYVRVPAANVTVVPEQVELRVAPLIEPTVTVVHALRRARCGVGDRVGVLGTGTLGLMAIQIARAMGAEADAIGVEQGGLELAGALGASRALHVDEAEDDAYSVVIEVSGAAPGAELALRVAEPGARVSLVGITSEASPILTARAVLKDLEINGVLGGVKEFGRAAELFASGRLDPARLIDDVVPAAEAATAYELLLRGNRPRPKLLLDFGG